MNHQNLKVKLEENSNLKIKSYYYSLESKVKTNSKSNIKLQEKLPKKKKKRLGKFRGVNDFQDWI